MATLDESDIALPQASIRWAWITPEMLNVHGGGFLEEPAGTFQPPYTARSRATLRLLFVRRVRTHESANGGSAVFNQLAREADFTEHRGFGVLRGLSILQASRIVRSWLRHLDHVGRSGPCQVAYVNASAESGGEAIATSGSPVKVQANGLPSRSSVRRKR